jgi:hypothetical protein
MFKCLVALIAVFPGAVLAATVWTWVDEQGQRHYSDREVPGATEMQISSSQTFSGTALRPDRPSAAPSPEPAPAPQAVDYTVLDVLSPEAEESLWNIAGNLPVTLASVPALASAHHIDVILDGERMDVGTRSLEITIPEVWRGEHTLQAIIVDDNGQVLKRSAPVTFFVRQTSIQN